MHLFIGAAARRASDWKDLRGPFISAALEAGGSRILSTAGRKIRYRFPSSKLSTRHVWEVNARDAIRHTGTRRISAVLRRELRGPRSVVCACDTRPRLHTLYLRETYSPCATGSKARGRFRRCAELKTQLNSLSREPSFHIATVRHPLPLLLEASYAFRKQDDILYRGGFFAFESNFIYN